MKNIKQAEFGRREIEIAEQGKSGAWGSWGSRPGAVLSGDQSWAVAIPRLMPQLRLRCLSPLNQQTMWGRARRDSKRQGCVACIF